MDVEYGMLTTGFDSCQGNGRLAVGDITKLSAGPIDIAPATSTDIHIESRLAEIRLKTKHVFVGRTMESTPRKLIERDQIDFAAQGSQSLH